jgi:hypothetical protein
MRRFRIGFELPAAAVLSLDERSFLGGNPDESGLPERRRGCSFEQNAAGKKCRREQRREEVADGSAHALEKCAAWPVLREFDMDAPHTRAVDRRAPGIPGAITAH